ncbi:aldo/keto reductase [Pontiellaceae bacterium B1224]|nr:aldo/keto reductase [Pontiellaceae bacterium B1224]
MSLTENDSSAKGLPRRHYKDDVYLSTVGFGGIVVMDAEQDAANQVVAEAVERGVNYFDVAPSYGNAQEKLGPALEPFRKEVFLACKSHLRSAEETKRLMDESLSLLKTDYFDLYQLHGIVDVETDVDTAFGPGGAWEPILKAKEAGVIKYLGFSAHTVEACLAALKRYPFDSILFPVNFASFYEGGFGPEALAQAKAHGAKVLALKSLARQKWTEGHPKRKQYSKCWYEPIDDPDLAWLAMRFTLSQDVVAMLPPGEEPLWRMAMEQVPRGFAPLSTDELERLKTQAGHLDPIFRIPDVGTP